MYSSTGFYFNGIHSSVFGVESVRDGHQDKSLNILGASVHKTKSKENSGAILSGVEYGGGDFKLLLAKSDGTLFSGHNLADVAEWLRHETFKELYTDELENMVYNVILKNMEKIYIGGGLQGLVECTFETKNWYRTSHNIELIYNTPGTYVMDNKGNLADRLYSPEVVIDNNDATLIRFTNLTTGETPFVITPLPNEIITITEKKIATSSIRTNPYLGLNFKWLNLTNGPNDVMIDIEGGSVNNITINNRFRVVA